MVTTFEDGEKAVLEEAETLTTIPDTENDWNFFFQTEDGIREYNVTEVQTVCSSDLRSPREAAR